MADCLFMKTGFPDINLLQAEIFRRIINLNISDTTELNWSKLAS